MPDQPSGEAPRFERDLREIRESREVSLPEVQQQTRIPLDVLERFETGRLASDPHFGEVYLKALIRAYAEAINVSAPDAIQAHEDQKAGVYKGSLRRHLGEATAPPVPEEPAAVEEAEVPPTEDEPSAVPPAGAAPPAVEALRGTGATPTAEAPPSPRSEPKSRVAGRESVTSSTTTIDSSWGLIIGGALVAVLVIAGVLFLLLRDDTPVPVGPAPAEEVAEDPEVAEEPDEAAPPATDAPQLQLPIQVTLLAEDDALQGIRVTEAPDVRRPYWIEQGNSETFTSEQEVIIWGEPVGDTFGIPGAARLELQGYRWQPDPGSIVRIDPERGQALLDSLHRVQAAGAR